MPKTPFLGTAYLAKSSDLSAQRLINLYLESMQVKGGSGPGAFYGCPGLVLTKTIDGGPIRAAKVAGSYLYVISGANAYQVDGSFNATLLGTVGTSTGSAYIVANSTQVGFFDPTGLWVFTPATPGSWQGVTLPYGGTVGMPAYLDTFCLLNQPGTFNIWQSNSNDLLTWDPLNFTTEDGNAEPVVGLAALHDQIAVLKTHSMCFYVNQGNNGFVFGRLEGIYPAVGAVNAPCIQVVNDRLFWLGQTSTTKAKVYGLDGYQPVAVSTYAIDNAIDLYSSYSDAYAFGYGQEGHSFYVVSFPTGNQTWVYDMTESPLLKQPVWHQRAAFTAGQFQIYAGSCASMFNGQVYMGDRANGSLYRLDLTVLTDNGAIRKWLRSWRATEEAQYRTERCNWLDIQCQTGIGVPPGTNPQVVLRQSFDDGQTWSAELYTSVGRTGETSASIHFTRLGSTRRGTNNDRVFELSSTDQFPVAMMSAEIG